MNVASAIIVRETGEGPRILIARRKFDASLEAGKWEFPGGKLEAFEHPEDCLVREIREELGLAIEVGGIFDVASNIFESAKGPIHILLLCYLCRTSQESFELLEVSDAKWITPLELREFDYAAADVKTVEELRRHFGVV